PYFVRLGIKKAPWAEQPLQIAVKIGRDADPLWQLKDTDTSGGDEVQCDLAFTSVPIQHLLQLIDDLQRRPSIGDGNRERLLIVLHHRINGLHSVGMQRHAIITVVELAADGNDRIRLEELTELEIGLPHEQRLNLTGKVF